VFFTYLFSTFIFTLAPWTFQAFLPAATKYNRMEIVSDLMDTCLAIKRKYEAAAQTSGESFNIFRILKLATREVRLHSALLGELLNVQGSHNMGNVFLTKFIEQLLSTGKIALANLHQFDTEHSTVDLEYSLEYGNRELTGGRVDILLRDTQGRFIIIENKIYAGDQLGQLVRYNSIKSKLALLYLTIDGRNPSLESSGNLLLDKDFSTLSYKKDIREWLEACLKVPRLSKLVESTIRQYIYLLDDFTGQSNTSKMSVEVLQQMQESDARIQASFLIASHLEGLKGERAKFIRLRLEEQLRVAGCDYALSSWYFTFPRIEIYPTGWNNHLIGFTDEKGLLFGIKRRAADVNPIRFSQIDTQLRDEFRESEWWLCYSYLRGHEFNLQTVNPWLSANEEFIAQKTAEQVLRLIAVSKEYKELPW
jgi:PD-(D/E)XK nuclease superfamily protein